MNTTLLGIGRGIAAAVRCMIQELQPNVSRSPAPAGAQTACERQLRAQG